LGNFQNFKSMVDMATIKKTGGLKDIVDSGSSAPLSEEDSEKIKEAYEKSNNKTQLNRYKAHGISV